MGRFIQYILLISAKILKKARIELKIKLEAEEKEQRKLAKGSNQESIENDGNDVDQVPKDTIDDETESKKSSERKSSSNSQSIELNSNDSAANRKGSGNLENGNGDGTFDDNDEEEAKASPEVDENSVEFKELFDQKLEIQMKKFREPKSVYENYLSSRFELDGENIDILDVQYILRDFPINEVQASTFGTMDLSIDKICMIGREVDFLSEVI